MRAILSRSVIENGDADLYLMQIPFFLRLTNCIFHNIDASIACAFLVGYVIVICVSGQVVN